MKNHLIISLLFLSVGFVNYSHATLEKSEITIIGGAQGVSGSCYLFETNEKLKKIKFINYDVILIYLGFR